MKIDLVHDIQTLYRKVVDAMSRPGVLSDLSAECNSVKEEDGCYHSSLLLALMLLDTEVTFHVVSHQGEAVKNRFYQLTYAKTAEIGEADFIFVTREAVNEDLKQVLSKAKVGELNDPHDSALIIIEVDSLTEGHTLKLTGPGIKDENEVQVSTDLAWLSLREQRNSDYPLGVDMVFVDADHQMLCLPRTTKVLQQEV
ncbi:phosphonate C-P lyase system protein PhnH [Litoribacterium kuwaitense]|uniref:phosphonate C-P lyase system protein PhnH n=1 Tax=Litoribacterium kuwaitense TaxID=1398745 RepID=UPI001FE5827B|nr:phosphonate C-P lyase system protein PhnH [Litoribacterium kuwaitense]